MDKKIGKSTSGILSEYRALARYESKDALRLLLRLAKARSVFAEGAWRVKNLLYLSLLIFTSVFSIVAAPTITMRLTDTSGHTVHEAVIGTPFLLEAIVEGDQHDVQTVNVAGLSQFHAQNYGTMSSITQVNGIMTVKKTYRYKLRCNKTGRFTVGPAMAPTQQGIIRSEPITFNVIEEQQVERKKGEIALKLITDKKWVVVGERIPVTIRLYADPEYKLHGLHPSQSQLKSQMGAVTGPHMGSEKVDGQMVTYREWHTEFIPKEQGTLIIPAFKVDYATKKKQHDDAFDLMMQFGDLFGQRYEHQHVYSNPLIVTVDPLPPHKEHVQAIGTFTELIARVDHQTAREGDGIVYSIELQGDGNWPDIAYPTISVPESLKHYESKTTIKTTKKGLPCAKVFEYIIQGLQPGEWQVPAQTFTYFDTKERTYKTLISNPVAVTITAFGETSPRQAADQKDAVKDTFEPLFTIKQWPKPMRTVPWPLFWFLSIFPALWYGCWFAQQTWRRYKARNNSALRKKYALAHARKQLKRAVRLNDLKLVYDTYMQLFADRCQKSVADLTDERITEIIHEACTDAETTEWQTFFRELSEIIFCKKTVEQHTQQALFGCARQWLERLEGRL